MTSLDFFLQNNPIHDSMIYAPAARKMCEEFASLEAMGWDVAVVGNHLSKSIRLPVVRLEHPCGVTVYARHNFHNLAVTVESRFPLQWTSEVCDFSNTNPVYFEGFEEAGIAVYRAPLAQKASFFSHLPLKPLLALFLAQAMGAR